MGISSVSRRSPRSWAATTLLTLVAVVAVLAMHGISGHGADVGGGAMATGIRATHAADHHGHDADTPAPAAADHEHADVRGDHDHAPHGSHGHGDEPCACPHGAAALCAFVVLGAHPSCPPPATVVPAPADPSGAPTRLAWSPDPPVPRSLLVTSTH